MKMEKGKLVSAKPESMERMRGVGKSVLVILTYYVLIKVTRLIMFWMHMQQATSLEYTWEGKRGEFFFWWPYDFGLPCLFVQTCILFLIFHGRDLELGRWRQIRQIAKKFWMDLGIKAAVLAGSIFGVMWSRGFSRVNNIIINSVISPERIYYFLSGTAFLQPYMGGGEAAETIFKLGTIFELHMLLWDTDMLNTGIAFLVYECLRICFDKKVPLKN